MKNSYRKQTMKLGNNVVFRSPSILP